MRSRERGSAHHSAWPPVLPPLPVQPSDLNVQRFSTTESRRLTRTRLQGGRTRLACRVTLDCGPVLSHPPVPEGLAAQPVAGGGEVSRPRRDGVTATLGRCHDTQILGPTRGA